MRIPVAAVALALALALQAAALSDPHRVRPPAASYELQPLQWGSVNPSGWLRDFAVACRHGAGSSNRSAFAVLRPDNQSVNGWRQGRPTKGGFWGEDSAYFMDGLTRLGLVLQDEELLSRARADYEAVMAHPWWFHNTFPGDIVEGWVRSIYARGMLAYYSGTGDKRITAFLGTAFANYTAQDSVLGKGGQWARSVTQVEALLEGYAYGGPAHMLPTGLSLLSGKGGSAVTGIRSLFEVLTSGCSDHAATIAKGGCGQQNHGVTFNELAKMFAIGWSWNENSKMADASFNAFDMLSNYDVQVHGVVSADEALNGIGPNAATETCDVSDYLYSLTWMMRIGGIAAYGDSMERAFYNAAPGAVNRSYSGHVYYQSPNLMRGGGQTKIGGGERWESKWYHVPPCCTGNQVRIPGNFIHHMWFGSHALQPVEAFVLTMYGPNRVSGWIGGSAVSRGTNVTIVQDTAYPFEPTTRLTVLYDPAATPEFGIRVRIPLWCSRVAYSLDGQPDQELKPDALGFALITARWHSGSVVTIRLDTAILATIGTTFSNGAPWPGGMKPYKIPVPGVNVTAGVPFCHVRYGPLLFALPLEVPGSSHGFALLCNASTMTLSAQHVQPGFDWALDAPLKVTAQAQPFAWRDVWDLPAAAVPRNASVPLVNITLVPYGAAKLFHVSMFPFLA